MEEEMRLEMQSVELQRWCPRSCEMMSLRDEKEMMRFDQTRLIADLITHRFEECLSDTFSAWIDRTMKKDSQKYL